MFNATTPLVDRLRGWIGVAIAVASLAWSVFVYLVPTLGLRGAGGTDKTATEGGVDAVLGIAGFRHATVDLPWWTVVGVWVVEACATAFVFLLCDQLVRDRSFPWRLQKPTRIAVGVITSTHLFGFHLWFFWPRLTSAGIAASIVASVVVIVMLRKHAVRH
ncbi:hypothetical protein Afil01_45620 [Actinorhabdospora filicis]|uniref:Uncharacterized protein n=1 Tax=Actinorhabdospora filicis TaxID=1785913 RepID=A0A9W6SPR7_9ACTN|nr:hypothetical protein [Actinorhabdospora filicis]GLZ79755.1 hypothetical protein Afil01_45620 [Actinorhabdospora filicis]